MKNKEVSANGIIGFIKGNKRLLPIIILVILGIGLIALSGSSAASADDENDALEAQLSEMCSSLAGVGSCRVMVTYKISEGRYGSSGTKTVESVAIVCKGADKAGVRKELTDMMSALFGIGTNRIHIAKMK